MEDSNTLNHKVDGQLRKSIDFDYIQLAKNCKGYLDLRSSKITLEELTILIPHIVGNIRINTFDLSQNHFSDEYGRIIARIIKNSDSIVEFCLKLNNLEGRGVQYIGQAIGYNNSIEILDMSWNHIRWPGAVSICNGIKINNCLNTLNVAYNGFGYEGAVALGEMLKHNKTLQTLDVSSNRICWKGSLIISKGLSKNRSLINLKVIFTSRYAICGRHYIFIYKRKKIVFQFILVSDHMVSLSSCGKTPSNKLSNPALQNFLDNLAFSMSLFVTPAEMEGKFRISPARGHAIIQD
ncbi:leucine-rich repeat-containing protein 74B-like [Octopus sinensis]|uniref:Leucine-rich repeat-containing protein 74B-like n=1 Tax=Octopus sinensis TaxID=2607531 RepID=A0A7E6FJY2_9MOLL|nr:leucine-rich repeat-containing protein 74B-like [Octopus sinensis]